ncbi:hypothetical protein SANTM175S_06491 [Streptomyces antimycoticus]
MRGEWNAWLTVRRLVLRPCASNAAAIRSASSSSPATTTDVGPLSAAIDTRSVSSGATSSSDAWTAIIAPPAGSSCISRPRAATSFAASASESTPATWAAASSPIEWPDRKSAFRPQVSTSRNSATSMANSAGWVNPVRSSAAASSPNSTSRSGRSRCASRWAHTSSSASANTGKVSYSSRPMPSRWLPCPVKRNATLPPATEPSTRPGTSDSPRASAARPAGSPSPLSAVSTARWSRAARVVASE